MPSEFPRSPKLLKGALVVYESQSPGPPPKIIVFQYNPEQLERKLENRAPEKKRGANAKEDVLRVAGPPKETITLTVVLNAADQDRRRCHSGALGHSGEVRWPAHGCAALSAAHPEQHRLQTVWDCAGRAEQHD